MVNTADNKLLALGIELPPAVTPFGPYVPAVHTGSLLFLSGMLPMVGHEPKFVGRVGDQLSTEQGREASRTAALNVLAVAKAYLGSLDKISRIARLGVYVATAGESSELVKVADAASELLRDVLGEERNPVRLVFGVASLPFGTPVELEAIFEVSG